VVTTEKQHCLLPLSLYLYLIRGHARERTNTRASLVPMATYGRKYPINLV